MELWARDHHEEGLVEHVLQVGQGGKQFQLVDQRGQQAHWEIHKYQLLKTVHEPMFPLYLARLSTRSISFRLSLRQGME